MTTNDLHTALDSGVLEPTIIEPNNAPVSTASATSKAFYGLIVRLHFYAGIFVAPFIFLTAVTGLLYTFSGSIDKAVYQRELIAHPQGTTQLNLSELVSKVLKAYPEGSLNAIIPATTPADTTRVILKVPTLSDGYVRTVFVNPSSGEIQGALTTYGEWLPVQSWFDELHRNLHLGSWGRNYSELSASWLWFIALGGLILWLRHKKPGARLSSLIHLPVFARNDKPLNDQPLDDKSLDDENKRGKSKRWHTIVGLWLLPAMLFLSVTGLTWSRWAGENIDSLRSHLSWQTPSVTTGHHAHHHSESSQRIDAQHDESSSDIDRVYQAARDQHLSGPLTIKPSGEKAWTVQERKRTFPTKNDAISVDPHTGAVIDRIDFASWPLVAKLTRWLIDMHMGILFGLANRIALFAIALGLISVIVHGYRMWWQRKPVGSLPRMPQRGVLHNFQPALAVLICAGFIGLGLGIPLWGFSVAVFIVVDFFVGLFRSEKSAD